MLECCGLQFEPERMITPHDVGPYTDRHLEIGRCPKCGALRCELFQYDIRSKEFRRINPKKKDVLSFIRRLESGKYTEELQKVKYGTKSNMSWMTFDGSISPWVYDFNGTKQFKQNEEFKTISI